MRDVGCALRRAWALLQDDVPVYVAEVSDTDVSSPSDADSPPDVSDSDGDSSEDDVPPAGAGTGTTASEATGDHFGIGFPGWCRPVPDPGPPHKAFRNKNNTYTEGGTAFARARWAEGHHSELRAFRMLWTVDLVDRICRCTNAKLAAMRRAPTDTKELTRFFALRIAMGMRDQGSIPSYWNTTNFGTCASTGVCVR